MAGPRPVLTEQQAIFIETLAKDPTNNAAAAARAAGYSPKAAKAQAYKLLEQPHIAAAYKELVDRRMARYGVTDCTIIEGLAHIAFGDRRKVLQWTKSRLILTPSEDLFPEEAALVKKIVFRETEEGRVPEVTFHSSQEALVALAKIKGLLRERLDVSVDMQFSNAAQWAKDTLENLFGAEEEGTQEATT